MKVKLAAVLVLGVVGVGAVAYATGAIGANAATGPEYLTATASTGDVSEEVAATGTLESTAEYGLAFGSDPYRITSDDDAGPASEATWPVKTVDVAVGDAVAEGDKLATADTTDLRDQLDLAKSKLESARINLRAAKDTLEDAEDADVTAQIRQAKMGLISAKTEVASAETEVDDLRDQIRAATLTSPIDGTVTAVNIEAGDDAPTGAAIVVAANDYEITTDVVESDLADIAVGQEAAITISAIDADVTGTVTAISPVAGDGSTGVVAYPVTITLTNAPDGARAGMSADVTVTTASATGVLTVPASALRGSDGNYMVMTLGADGSATPTPVDVGLVTNTAAEIKSGIAEGTTVVTGTASDLAGTTNNGQFGGGGFGPVRGAGPGGATFERAPDVVVTQP